MATAKNNSGRGKIESDKVLIGSLFTDFWFKIPEYQRSYVWTEDEVSELINDISYAVESHPQSEYFLGSMVLQKKTVSSDDAKFEYIEYDLLDGQQRLTTLFMMLAVIRDLAKNDLLVEACNEYIYQKEQKFKKTPERLRIVYKIREDVESFIHTFLKEKGGTLKTIELQEKAETKDVSILHMAKAIIFMNEYFGAVSQKELEDFSEFLFNNVILIYVSSEDLEDAFRLFTILNNRGLPLTNSDILKAWNLGATDDKDKDTYAKFWEELESSIGRDEFERLLSIIRTIYVKDKARENILKEFEEKIYGAKPALLTKGKQTFEVIKEYADIYNQLLAFEDIHPSIPNQYKNLIQIMRAGLPSNDWIPSLLAYYKKFGSDQLLKFTLKLNNKFSADWILQETPSVRINNMSNVLKAIEKAANVAELFQSKVFEFNLISLERYLRDQVYRKRYGKYLLLTLEYLKQDHAYVFSAFQNLSVEHVLPQNPSEKSKWVVDFTPEQKNYHLHVLGNLILISRKKNTSLGRKDFVEKKNTYFTGFVSVFPNSVRIMKYNEWNPKNLIERHEESVKDLMKHYSI